MTGGRASVLCQSRGDDERSSSRCFAWGIRNLSEDQIEDTDVFSEGDATSQFSRCSRKREKRVFSSRLEFFFPASVGW